MGPCQSQPTFSPTGSRRSKRRWSLSARSARRPRPGATGAEALVAHLKLIIAKLRRERFGPSAERGAKLELKLEELEASASEGEFAAASQDLTVVPSLAAKSRCALSFCRANAW
jgi:hypothetical protein